MDAIDYRVACTAVDGGTAVSLRLVPRAAATNLGGLHGQAVKLRVAAPPVDGKANDAALALLAEVLGVRASALALVRGEKSRSKVVRVDGLPVEVVAGRLAAATR
jgi:uncharacterized protein (TIGR00251 family)